MRLIDADELLLRYSNSEDVPTATPEEHNVYIAAVMDFFNHVGASPTIEAEPVRHGEWCREEEYGVFWVCDQCGFASEYKDNYCPNCGAKMDGG